MELKTGERTQDELSAMFISNRKIIYIEGYLHYLKGTDGEPLLVACKEITKDEYSL